MKIKKRKPFRLVFVLIIAVVGTILVYVSQNNIPPFSKQVPWLSTDSTKITNWKTYTSSESGFSLSYPAVATESGRRDDAYPVARQFYYSEVRADRESSSSGWLIIISKTLPNPNNLTLKQWALENKLTVDGKDKSQFVPSDTSLAGLPAISWSASNAGNVTYYLVKRKEGVMLVLGMVDRDVPHEAVYKETVNQVLSTLKFSQ